MVGNNKVYIFQNPTEFDIIIRKTIPYYETMLQAIKEYIPFSKDNPIIGLDVGCGTGSVTKMLLAHFPLLRIDCLDFSLDMLAALQKNLNDFVDHYSIINQDIRDFKLSGQYNLIVSNLSIHHINSLTKKREFYEKIFDLLLPNGVFVVGDMFLGANSHLNEVYEEKWKKFNISCGGHPTEVHKKHEEMKDVDFPSSFISQLNILQQIGFRDVDCVFKYYNFGVIGCVK